MSSSARSRWTPDLRSLRWRLPLLMSGLMLVLLSSGLVLTYREVARIQLQTVGTRAQFAADQLAEQLALANPQRLGEAQRLVDRADVAACVAGQTASCDGFVAALKAVPTTANLVVEVWTSDGRRVVSVAGASAAAPQSDGAPPSRQGVGVAPLKRHGKTLYSEIVIDVPAREGTAGMSGLVVVRRQLATTPNRGLLNQLVGNGAAIKLGNQIGDVWTDLAGEVPAPRVDLTRPGIAHYRAADGTDFVGALSHIKGTPWAVWVEFPEGATLNESRAFLRRMSAGGIGIMLVGSILVWVVISRITTPLTNLTDQAEALAAGDFSRIVRTTRHDEIGRLTNASNEMARRIREAQETLERRVTDRTADLAAANEELESFSYSVSHDLRAPLRHIGGFAALLEKSAAARLQETDRRYLNTIIEAATRMGRLIDDLLAFSRTGRSPLVKSSVKLQPLVEDVQREVASLAQGRTINWVVHPLPEVQADPSMLRQVLLNLLSNAVKYTAGRADARVEIGASDDGNEITIYVRDNGVGFDMQYVHKPFGVFQRLHRAEEFEGTGIGLANVRRIVHRHGGRVWAEGVLNTGATFYFSLPTRARAHA